MDEIERGIRKEWMTTTDALLWLAVRGLKRTRPWLYGFCKSGKLRYRKMGRTRLFGKREIAEFMQLIKAKKENPI